MEKDKSPGCQLRRSRATVCRLMSLYGIGSGHVLLAVPVGQLMVSTRIGDTVVKQRHSWLLNLSIGTS